MRVEFGYRAVEEQYQPSRLVDFAVLAERQGFDFVCISDHFHPWFHEGGCAGHAWIWIGAAGARTKRVRLGTGVTVPIYRYHPAIVAQAFATLGELYPGRIFLGLGTGEAMNEVPLGFRWPPFKERAERLEEGIRIIKSLWEGEFITFNGKYFKLCDARLYTKPREKVPLYIAASGPTVARMAGKHGDGFMTAATVDAVYPTLFSALAEGAKEAGRRVEAIPRMVELKISYDEDYGRALNSLAKWRVTRVSSILSKSICDPRELDELGRQIDLKGLSKWVCTDMEQCIRLVEECIKAGFNEVQVGSSSPNEEEFIIKFGKEALPYLREQYTST